MIQDGFDSTRHKKKSTKQKTKKSKHKHDYEDVIIVMKGHERFPHGGKMCKVCQKINLDTFFFKNEMDRKVKRVLTTLEEVRKIHKDLKVVICDKNFNVIDVLT